jgi:hypothetical protein
VIGYNVDSERLRPIIVNVIKTNKDLAIMFANGSDQRGVVAGQTPEQQFREVDTWLNRFKK